jgi:hypothetical protein
MLLKSTNALLFYPRQSSSIISHQTLPPTLTGNYKKEENQDDFKLNVLVLSKIRILSRSPSK